jgi:serine protease Do
MAMKQTGGHGLRNVLVAAGALVLLGALGRAAVSIDTTPSKPTEIRIQSEPEPETPGNDIRRDATVDAVKRVLPSVVNVATSRIVEYHDFYDDLRRQFFGLPPSQPQAKEQPDSLGSGVIIDEDGYILTNWHVVRRGTRVQVKLYDGRVYEADKIVATAKSDVALLKIRAKPGEKFQPIKFAKDDDLLLGETVMALGDPFGLGGSVSRGILSSKNRRPLSGNEPLNIADWLQTDAAINPGNSGGPLIDLRGELIGLNVAVYREGQGIGFAIPVKQVRLAISQFFSPEVYGSLWFGAHVEPGSTPLTVANVQSGSPAAVAGLKEGTQILSVNGKLAATLIEFNEAISASDGHRARLVVLDDSKRRDVTVTLVPFEDLVKQKTGLTLAELTQSTAARFGGRVDGMLIDAVEADSPAAKAELPKGILLTGVDDTPVTELRDVALVLTRKAKGDAVQLTLLVPRRYANGYFELRQAQLELKVR